MSSARLAWPSSPLSAPSFRYHNLHHAVTPPILGGGAPAFLQLAPTPRPQGVKGIIFNTDMGGDDSGATLFQVWRYYSKLHILLALGMLLYWMVVFMMPYRLMFFQGGI